MVATPKEPYETGLNLVQPYTFQLTSLIILVGTLAVTALNSLNLRLNILHYLTTHVTPSSVYLLSLVTKRMPPETSPWLAQL